ncbi:MAG: outer membrane lipoprotein-sorting protein, partial [Candidatus Anammoxibacter sp.]
RRISSSNRGDYFLGTDFTYEEIKKETKVDIDDYNRTTIGEEVIDGHKCYLVESIPVSDEIAKELGYSKTHEWVDSGIWIKRKAIMWDVKGNLLKTILFTDIRKVQDIWTVHQMDVKNHKTGHSTKFVFRDVDYQSEVKDELFTEQALRRGL